MQRHIKHWAWAVNLLSLVKAPPITVSWFAKEQKSKELPKWTHTAVAAGLTPTKERSFLLSGGDRRPAVVFITHWAGGRDAALDVIVVNPLHIGGTMNMCWGHFFYCRSHMYNIKSIALTQPNPTSTPTLTQPYLECLVGDELLCLASCLFSSLSHLLCQVSHFLQNKTRGLQLWLGISWSVLVN